MNGGILHAARPTDSMPKGNFGGIPAEAIQMARQMGLTPEDMKQMNSMWKNMDDLAESDPEAYGKFTSEILAEGPPGQGKAKTFVPEPSFVVKLRTKDGAKVFINMTSHEALEAPKDGMGRAVQKGERRNAEGLQIPLLVSEVRGCADHSGESGSAHAVDCVFNPWVTERCEDDNFFKATTIDLALQWVEQETDLSLEKKWKTIKSKYKGGLGADLSLPQPFPVDRAMMQDGPVEEREEVKEVPPPPPPGAASGFEGAKPGLATLSPEALLRAAKGESAEGGPGAGGREDPPVTLPASGSTGRTALRGPLIQEVGQEAKTAQAQAPRNEVGGAVKTGIGSKPAGKGKAKPAVKAGFLNPKGVGKVPQIYDEKGSSGDGMKEGTYSRFMGKCKVVDMSTMSEADQKKAMMQHAAPGTAAAPPQASPDPSMLGAPPASAAPEAKPEAAAARDAFGGLGKGFLGGQGSGRLYGDEGSCEGSAKAVSKAVSTDALFDSLLQGIDPDYLDASTPRADGEDDGMAGQLQQLASVLAGGGAFGKGLGQPDEVAADTKPKTRAPCRGLDEGPRPLREPVGDRGGRASGATDASFDHQWKAGEGTAELVVDLKGVDFGDVSLEVGDEELRVGAPKRHPLLVQVPFAVDKGRVKAKFSKAKGALKVTLQELRSLDLAD